MYERMIEWMNKCHTLSRFYGMWLYTCKQLDWFILKYLLCHKSWYTTRCKRVKLKCIYCTVSYLL
jgi:hypothetical protein